jgi:hypothetical protein
MAKAKMQMKPGAEEWERLLEQGEFLLKAFHEKKGTNEEEFWRGNVAGFRIALESLYGTEETARLLSQLRKKTRLDIPHSGLKAVGGYLGTDSEADE